MCIPRHPSGTRAYYPVAYFDADVIASDATFTVRDPDGLQFAVLSSSMFITWQKAIGGRIKSDLRFGSTLTWYTFPLPALTAAQRAAIIAAGRGVLAARALHPDRSLAEHYIPMAMDSALLKAHDALDRAVDRAVGARKRCTSEMERQQLLFAEYARLTAPLI